IMCLFQMTVCRRALILLLLSSCVDSAPSPVLQMNKYSNSFRLTRSTRTHVQQLLRKYSITHREIVHSSDYFLLCVQDWERLHAAFWDMQAYWNMLEWKNNQLEKDSHTVVRTTLPQSIKHIQLDLRDLMNRVRSQMSYVKGSQMRPTSPMVQTPSKPENSSNTAWDRRVEGYIILRDLELYLTKLARDFLLFPQGSPSTGLSKDIFTIY
uniref:Ciliary neurotrophic factor n=1 Tax=Scophthalmus maximus TaxID=52904 RepID=A0A8D3BXU6_SCOMX